MSTAPQPQNPLPPPPFPPLPQHPLPGPPQPPQPQNPLPPPKPPLSTDPAAPKKRLVIFADGTGQSAAQQLNINEYSNILRLSRCVPYLGASGIPQQVLYVSGVGTESEFEGVPNCKDISTATIAP